MSFLPFVLYIYGDAESLTKLRQIVVVKYPWVTNNYRDLKLCANQIFKFMVIHKHKIVTAMPGRKKHH